jgi:hypothetical protein
MSVVRREQYESEVGLFQCSHEPGVQHMRSLLYAQRDRINTEWLGMTGEDLIRKQGEAKAVAKLIRMIDFGPNVKPSEGGAA